MRHWFSPTRIYRSNRGVAFFLPFSDGTQKIRPPQSHATALSEGRQGFCACQIWCPQNGSMALCESVFIWCLNFRGQTRAVFLDSSRRNATLEILPRGKHLILFFSILTLDYGDNDSPFLVKCNTLNFPDHTIYLFGGSCGNQN